MPTSLLPQSEVTRSTPSGYWKKTGEDKKVREKETGTVIGTKKILVFYEGQGKNGVKTNYVVHEYHLHGDDFDRIHVLCRLKLKRDKKDESYLGIINPADLELDYDHESSFLEDLVQAGMNSLREFIPPENQLQPALGRSQNNSFPPTYISLRILRIHLDIRMNRRARTTDSVHGFVPLEEKKGVVENKFNDTPFASEKPMPRPVIVAPRRPMAPPVRPASVKCYSKDEEQRCEKVKRETAVINIKPERMSLDETAARAKVTGYKERGSAGNSTKKTNKENKYAGEKSNSVAASTGTTSESTKPSANPPLQIL
ncbi:hypothetical protein NL676_038393 [Syzygium grande]|nr:hypothetical protein NL676_038393 [Syzygium grande]